MQADRRSANMDPEGLRSDAELNDALSLIHSSSAAGESMRDKFKLDVEVQSDGSNFSAGEKQLLSLLRALVRGCKVLVMDEATSSVDPETDALIQRIIQTEFSQVTVSAGRTREVWTGAADAAAPLHCTSAADGSILRQDPGHGCRNSGRGAYKCSETAGAARSQHADVQYDTPMRLFDTPGSIFRSLCDVKKISRKDLLQIQADAASTNRRG